MSTEILQATSLFTGIFRLQADSGNSGRTSENPKIPELSLHLQLSMSGVEILPGQPILQSDIIRTSFLASGMTLFRMPMHTVLCRSTITAVHFTPGMPRN